MVVSKHQKKKKQYCFPLRTTLKVFGFLGKLYFLEKAARTQVPGQHTGTTGFLAVLPLCGARVPPTCLLPGRGRLESTHLRRGGSHIGPYSASPGHGSQDHVPRLLPGVRQCRSRSLPAPVWPSMAQMGWSAPALAYILPGSFLSRLLAKHPYTGCLIQGHS